MATLEDWENKLKSQMAQIELIGEVGLSIEETAEVGRLIRALLHARGPDRATAELRHHHPCIFAAYLVFQGVYSYEEGDYWSAICEATRLPPNWTPHWGQTFEAVVEKLGLSHEFAGHRYVGAILGHGGIPTGSLPDFFEHMLQPSVTKPEFTSLSTRELIEEWLTRSSHYRVDKPVLRFLEYGGQVAQDFVERCRQMAREVLDTGEIPTAVEMGLPESVVACYQEWIEALERFAPTRRTGPRLRKPQVVLDPWGLGVQGWLPEQQPPITQSQGEVWWEVSADEATEKVPVQVRWVDLDLKTESVSVPLQRPAQEYCVRLFVDGGCLREWSYDGVDDSHPLLVFDAETGVLWPQQKHLPGRRLWVLYPPDMELHSGPADRMFRREKLPTLPWAWHAWQAYAVDLAGISTLVLHTSQGIKQIAVVEERQQPELVEGAKVNLRDESMPLYVGEPPRLRIPWRQTYSLARWRLELRYEWEAEPPCNLKTTLDTLADRLHWDAEAVELPLAHPTLLGPSPLGQYRLRVRGPLGSGAEFRFRMVPKLVLTGHEPLYLPDPQAGAPPVQLLVETDTRSRLEPLQQDPTLELREVVTDAYGCCYQVDVPPERTEAPLRLVYDLSPGRTVYIPLHVPVHRLRWMLILRPAQLTRPDWRSRAIAVSLEELEQSEFPYLLLEIPGAEENTSIQLCFRDVDGALLQEEFLRSLDKLGTRPLDGASRPELETKARDRSLGPSRFCRFDLRLVRDTLRQSQSPAVRAELVVQGLPDHDTVTLPVLTVRRGLYVEQVNVTPRWERDQLLLDLAWHPDIPLKWRYVRFWSQSRPWSEPEGFSVPDDARSRHIIQVTTDVLPVGEYLVEFTVRDPWISESAPERPQPNAPNVASIVVGELERRLRQLDEAIAREDVRFSYVCERVFLWRALDHDSHAEQDLQWCYDHIEDASVEQMIALTRGFQNLPTARAIQLKLFRPERVRHMLNAYWEGRLSRAVLGVYLAQLPRISLLSPQACEALLDVPDDRIRLVAAQRLITRGRSSGIKAVLAWAEQGELSDAGALELLESNVALAVQVLGDHPDITTAARFLEALARAYPEDVPVVIIRPGYWICCQAGWGRIERIATPNGVEISHIHRKELQQGYWLHVTLRPGEDAEPVIIDTARGEIRFEHASNLYTCSKCNRFTTRNVNLLYRRHEPAAHEGMGTSFHPSNKARLHQRDPFDFAIRRPTNIWE